MRAGLIFAFSLYASICIAQTYPTIQKAVSRADVKAAMAHLEIARAETLALWKKLALTSAPSGHEDERAAIVMAELKRLG